jgi:hypothetical protein
LVEEKAQTIVVVQETQHVAAVGAIPAAAMSNSILDVHFVTINLWRKGTREQVKVNESPHVRDWSQRLSESCTSSGGNSRLSSFAI